MKKINGPGLHTGINNQRFKYPANNIELKNRFAFCEESIFFIDRFNHLKSPACATVFKNLKFSHPFPCNSNKNDNFETILIPRYKLDLCTETLN